MYALTSNKYLKSFSLVTVGLNTITRESTKSTVTVQTENIFQPEVVRKQCESKKQDPSTYITCGWPEYLLIPKGTSEGSEYILFAMVSNGADDCGVNIVLFKCIKISQEAYLLIEYCPVGK